jgi:hypothetical protein
MFHRAYKRLIKFKLSDGFWFQLLSDSTLGSQLFVPNLMLTVVAQGIDPNKFRDDQAN